MKSFEKILEEQNINNWDESTEKQLLLRFLQQHCIGKENLFHNFLTKQNKEEENYSIE